ncbi:MAG: hypothetical protein ACFE9Q_14950 [Candidatus Hodarchaeota archaeon]
MKKISYSLRIAIIGNIKSLEEIFFESLKKLAIDFNLSTNNYECLIVFKQIPIKIKIFIAEKLEDLIYKFEKIQKLDVIILSLNLYDPDSLTNITKPLLKEFNETYSFQGLSILVGMDIRNIFNISTLKDYKISRYQLEKISKNLNLIYCFEIFNKSNDIAEIYNTIMDDFMIRFQYSNPELFEAAKNYGKKLVS